MTANWRVLDDCPVQAGIGAYIWVASHSAHATCTSIYRGEDPAAVRILHKYGKHNQAELYYGWEHREPGFLPANPPGQSTHELRSDGVAYPGYRVGAVLPWWCQGFDLASPEEADAVIYQARIRGWDLFRPYSSGSEAHHLNFRRRPHPSTLRADGNAKRLAELRAQMKRS